MAIPIPTNSRKPDEQPDVLYMEAFPYVPQRPIPPLTFDHDDVMSGFSFEMTPRFRFGVNMDRDRIGRIVVDIFNV